MKQLSFLFIFMFFITLSLPQYIKAQEDCVEMNTPQDATCGSWVTHGAQITGSDLSSNWGDCIIYVGYQTRTCTITEGGCTRTFEQFQLGSINWDLDQCNDFTQFIMPGYPDNFSFDNAKFSIFLGYLMPYLMDKHYLDYFNSLAPAQQLALKCDGVDPSCTMPICASYEASYISSSCKDICFNLSNPNHPVLLFGDCSSTPQGCCILTTKYCPCFDNTNTYIGTIREINSSVDPGGCSGNGPLYGTCYYGTGGEDSIYEPCQALCPTIE